MENQNEKRNINAGLDANIWREFKWKSYCQILANASQHLLEKLWSKPWQSSPHILL